MQITLPGRGTGAQSRTVDGSTDPEAFAEACSRKPVSRSRHPSNSSVFKSLFFKTAIPPSSRIVPIRYFFGSPSRVWKVTIFIFLVRNIRLSSVGWICPARVRYDRRPIGPKWILVVRISTEPFIEFRVLAQPVTVQLHSETRTRRNLNLADLLKFSALRQYRQSNDDDS